MEHRDPASEERARNRRLAAFANERAVGALVADAERLAAALLEDCPRADEDGYPCMDHTPFPCRPCRLRHAFRTIADLMEQEPPR